MSGKQIRLFVVGRSGNGVTSTVNSLLNQDTVCCTSHDSGRPLLQQFQTYRGRFQTYRDDTFIVTDGSGVGDDGEDMQQPDSVVLRSIAEALRESSGFIALVFVIKFGVRFTRQEKLAVKKVKQYFGAKIFEQRGIIVLTHGDNFNSESVPPFEDWCQEQSGYFQDLLKTCKDRVVLFDNKTKDVGQKIRQKEQLKQAVNNLSYEISRPYALQDFESLHKELCVPQPPAVHYNVGISNVTVYVLDALFIAAVIFVIILLVVLRRYGVL